MCSVCEHWCSLEDLGSAVALPSSKPPRTLALYSPRPLTIFLSYGHDGFTSVRSCVLSPTHTRCAQIMHSYWLSVHGGTLRVSAAHVLGGWVCILFG